MGQAQAPTGVSETPENAELGERAAVTLGGQTLFTLQAKQTANSVAEHAQRMSERIEAIANDQSIAVEAIALSETEFGPTLFVEDRLIMTVTEEDVAGTGLTPQALAAQNLARIQAQITSLSS